MRKEQPTQKLIIVTYKKDIHVNFLHTAFITTFIPKFKFKPGCFRASTDTDIVLTNIN